MYLRRTFSVSDGKLMIQPNHRTFCDAGSTARRFIQPQPGLAVVELVLLFLHLAWVAIGWPIVARQGIAWSWESLSRNLEEQAAPPWRAQLKPCDQSTKGVLHATWRLRSGGRQRNCKMRPLL